MGQFEFFAKIIAPYFVEIPKEIDEKWLNQSKKAAPKTYKGIQKAIKTKKDFDEKIGNPTKKTIASFIDKNFVSRSGHTYRNIMDKTRDSMKNAGKEYLRGEKNVFETGRYEKKLEDGQKRYAQKWCEYLGPLKGYKAGHIPGLTQIAIMALTGDNELVNYLRAQGVSVQGRPMVITTPERVREFRNTLAKRILSWGSEIIKFGYEHQDVKRLNEKLNHLVNEYRRHEITPFTSGGPSHIDFIIAQIPDSTKPGGMRKSLGLDIQITME
ncbi:MAG TPA: hypothetical protein VJC37_06225 [Planctomycetota bacterium]|nr:hypothetical protein [Planctomycetota bacterium]